LFKWNNNKIPKSWALKCIFKKFKINIWNNDIIGEKWWWAILVNHSVYISGYNHIFIMPLGFKVLLYLIGLITNNNKRTTNGYCTRLLVPTPLERK